MTSDDIFPRRFTEIDDPTRPDHRYLADEDVCYYIGEYTARRGYACSATNDLIQNFKKPVSRRGQPQWSYKERAIRQAAGAFAAAPEFIAVVDDVLTTGAHYRAAKSLLSARFPGTRIAGLFIARRAPEASDV